MDPQIEKFLNDFADKTLNGSGFAGVAPEQKTEIKAKLLDYFSNLIFDTLLSNLKEEQLKELEQMQDLGSDEAQKKIALMSASIPGFIFILEDRMEKASEEVGRTGQIPELSATNTPAPNIS